MKANRCTVPQIIKRALVGSFVVMFALLNSGVGAAQAQSPGQSGGPASAGHDRQARLEGLANLIMASGKTDAIGDTSNLQKMDSHLQDLLSAHLRGADLLKAAASSDLRLANGQDVLVDIYVSGPLATASADLAKLGMDIRATNPAFGGVVEGYVPIDALLPAAKLGSTKALLSVTAFGVDAGSVTSQGDAADNGPAARALGATGAGVVVGVISDSINQVGGKIAGSKNLGDLPGNVNVLLDDTSGYGVDEGRAMAEIIYDTAPGITSMYFSSGTTSGAAAKAASINSLVAHGVDLIADDIYYLDEPFFQDGMVAQAVDNAYGAGVAYFASAGNRARQSYEQNYRNSGDLYASHDFDPGIGSDWGQTLTTIPMGACLRVVLQWDDPWRAATHDFDIYLHDVADGNQTNVIAWSEGDNIASGLPVEDLFWCNDAGGSVTVSVEIDKYSGSNTAFLKYISSVTISEYATDSDTINPDAASATRAMTVAAVNWSTAGLNSPESYSSRGPKTRLFSATGVRLGSPEIRQKPQIAGADCVITSSTFGGGAFGGGSFCGTSAATPSVAGIAALALSAKPTLTTASLYSLLSNPANTIDCALAGNPDNDCGYGFVLADHVVSAVMPTYAGIGQYDDGDPAWTYAGAWAGIAATGAYNNTLHVGISTGATASISFDGAASFALTYLTFASGGQMGLYLDGSATALTTVNTAGPTNLVTYTSPLLSPGPHTLTLKHNGPGGSMIVMDDIEIKLPTGWLEPGTMDDTNALMTYVGAWGGVSTPGTYDDSLHVAVSAGATATAYIDGGKFGLTYLTYPGWGQIGVYLDDSTTPLTTLNSNAAAGLPTYWSPALLPGKHKVTFKHAGPAGSFIALDALQVSAPTFAGVGTWDDVNDSWTYVGGWGAAAVPGAYDNTLHIGLSAGSSASFSYNGNNVLMTYLAYANFGLVGVYLDGSPTPLTVLVTNAPGGLVTLALPTLPGGQHTITFKHLGPAGAMIAIDKIEIQMLP